MLTESVENVAKAKVESVTTIIAALVALFAATMAPYISVGIVLTLSVALGTYGFAKRQKQEWVFKIVDQFERREAD